jgi:hypothetical protein
MTGVGRGEKANVKPSVLEEAMGVRFPTTCVLPSHKVVSSAV